MTIQELKKTANLLRQDVVKMISKAGSGHPAGSLGMADVLAVLYFEILSHKPENPSWPDRDRLILSNGHICPLLYATLARAGYLAVEELDSLRKIGSLLQGHPSKADFPLIEASSGSLGHGLAVAAGMAIAAKRDNKKHNIWCLTSDAEHQEGSTWETIMLSSNYKLSNLKAVVDYNDIQLSGDIKEIMPIEPLKEKYQAFGWQVFEVDGNNIETLLEIFKKAKNYYNGPCVILAKTIPGKGVSFMEGRWQWHGKAPDREETKKAIEELERISNF